MGRPRTALALATVMTAAATAVACGSGSETATSGSPASSTTAAPATSAPPTTAAPTTAPVPEAPGQVLIRDYELLPPTITIAAGATVTWQNRDDVDHDMITDDATTVRSNPIPPGQAYVATLSTPGTYDYYCDIHNAMTGTIIVE